MSLQRSLWAGGILLLGVVLGNALSYPRLWWAVRAQSSLSARQQRQQLLQRLDQAADELERHLQVYQMVVQAASPSVVHIEAQKPNPRSNAARAFIEEAGSGIIIQYQGRFYVLTNRHVVDGAPLGRITLHLYDGRELHPVRLRSDPETDIAVLWVAARDLTPARIGNSDQVQIGQVVLTMGSPFGLSRSVTAGIISAKGRRQLELGGQQVRYQDFLQTDAAINPGNSGGPLLNLHAEVVGMNTAIASNSGGNEGIGFSIPINMVMFVAGELIEHSHVRRAFLGVNLDGEFDLARAQQLGLPRKMGAYVTAVTPDSPAERAGIQPGDVVLRFDGKEVEDDIHLINLVGSTPVGKKVRIELWRQRRTVEVQATLVPRPGGFQSRKSTPPDLTLPRKELVRWNDLPSWDVDALGLTVLELSPRVNRRLKLAESQQGLLVNSVDAESPLAGKVLPGEVLYAVQQWSVRTAEELDRALSLGLQNPALRLHFRPGLAGTQTHTVTVPREHFAR